MRETKTRCFEGGVGTSTHARKRTVEGGDETRNGTTRKGKTENFREAKGNETNWIER